MSGHALFPGRKEWGDAGMWCRRCGKLIEPEAGGRTEYAQRPCLGRPADYSEPVPTPRSEQPPRRVSVYIDTRDWWVGLYIGPNHLYFCVFTLVLRVRRRQRES